MSHLSSPYEAFVSQANNVTPFGQDFKGLIKEMLAYNAYIPGNNQLIEGLHDCANTTHLLEVEATKMRRLLSNPEFIIREMEHDGAQTILSIAHLLQALEILHKRCAEVEQEMPVA